MVVVNSLSNKKALIPWADVVAWAFEREGLERPDMGDGEADSVIVTVVEVDAETREAVRNVGSYAEDGNFSLLVEVQDQELTPALGDTPADPAS